GRPLAIPLPGGGTRSRRGTVGAAQTLSRRAHRGALLSWYAVSRPRLLRRLPVPLLVRRRSLPVPGEHRHHRARSFGNCHAATPTRRSGGVSGCPRDPRRPDLEAEPPVRGRGDAVP